MNIRDVYSAKAIALVQTEAASNKVAYLGAGLFPARKKMGLDLKWIKTSKGLAVSLAPSNFDAVSTLRSREGFKMNETEMAFFRESMLIKEADEQEIMRVEDSSSPYATEVLSRIFDDANTLVAGANVVPERMIMQLLAPADGSPNKFTTIVSIFTSNLPKKLSFNIIYNNSSILLLIASLTAFVFASFSANLSLVISIILSLLSSKKS